MRKLERMGLAEEAEPGRWQLDDGLGIKLRRIGECGDIIKTMHRALTGKELTRSAADYVIHDEESKLSLLSAGSPRVGWPMRCKTGIF
ncbi:DUF3363 domain-containing protein [Mesorhizobium retamae]|uniref:DUF3363 domain-containing protein n=1 Tax=Mesorhizobium retamae TaxID=2912854 RepID=UPI0023B87C6A|nr:DUF3363 domain-containing protein [Mesorhizobium sp. IRAMC:0171]